MKPGAVPQSLRRNLLKQSLRSDESRDEAFRRIIHTIPRGRVSTYGKVAAAAGYPLYHRAVARFLRLQPHAVSWQRVVGAGGEIKLRGDSAEEQKLRLQAEGVVLTGKRVDMERFEHALAPWESFS